MASDGYCERSRLLDLCGESATECCDDACDSYSESTSSRSNCSRSRGGTGDFALRSLRRETEDGDREEGKDEKEG